MTNKRRRPPVVTSRRRKAVAVAFFAAIVVAVFACMGGGTAGTAPRRDTPGPVLSRLAFGVIGYCVGFTANRHVIAPAWARIIRPAFNPPEEEKNR